MFGVSCWPLSWLLVLWLFVWFPSWLTGGLFQQSGADYLSVLSGYCWAKSSCVVFSSLFISASTFSKLLLVILHMSIFHKIKRIKKITMYKQKSNFWILDFWILNFRFIKVLDCFYLLGLDSWIFGLLFFWIFVFYIFLYFMFGL